jgi:uncharacterized RDD family membrane protein YckC
VEPEVNTESGRLVEAALNRVRKAAVAPAPAQQTLGVDKEATAKALTPSVDPTNPYRKISAPRAVPRSPSPQLEVQAEPLRSEALDIEQPGFSVIDEQDPLDYLTAEIRKVDKELESQFERKKIAPLLTQAISGAADFLTIALSCAPFAALAWWMGSPLGHWSTQLGLLLLGVAVSLFYLVLTHCCCGRTFGMMLTNTSVVDADTLEPPKGDRALVRALGYILALAPFGIGLLWALIDKKRRGWQDLLADTVVVTDY